ARWRSRRWPASPPSWRPGGPCAAWPAWCSPGLASASPWRSAPVSPRPPHGPPRRGGPAAASTGAPVGSGVTGSDIGSTTGGGQGQAAGTGVSGFPSHVVFAAFPWRGVAFVGALAIIAAGVLVTWRALELPVMSSRYAPPAPASASPSAPLPEPAAVGDRARRRPDSAAIWESLSRGEDP